ncbi:uncharacterized protein B0T23DRAFT_392945 [Neurospora hispaniola]|uniref:Uncharacterized protein n=1 Tax=Neurospora hispaniola TaxID=588809 RepID=A0AAJ0MW63_9PEZI|nr:hypothetical protein B0T23DRAFT_392945 [Neurospora hispaniola]
MAGRDQGIPLAHGCNFATMRMSSSLRMTYNALTLLAAEIGEMTTKSPEEKVLAMYITAYEKNIELLLKPPTGKNLAQQFEFTTACGVSKRLRGDDFWTSPDGDSYTTIIAVFDAAFASTNKDMMMASASMVHSLRTQLSEDTPLKRFSLITLSDSGIQFFPDTAHLSRAFGSNTMVTEHTLKDEHPPRVLFQDSRCSFPEVTENIFESLYLEADSPQREVTTASRLVVFTTAAKNAGPLKKMLLTRLSSPDFRSAGTLRTWIVTANNVTDLLPSLAQDLKHIPNLKAVVFVTPEVRFLRPLKHFYKHFAFASESKFVFNRRLQTTVEDLVPVSQVEAQSFASVAHFGTGPAKITLLRREDAEPLAIFPRTESLAWLVEPMETLLLLIDAHTGVAVKDFLAVMSHARQCEVFLVDEMLYRLTHRQLLLKDDDKISQDGAYSLLDPSMPARLSGTGKLTDACLLFEMTKLAKEEGVSMAALQTLAACRSVMLVTVDWILKHVNWNSVAISEVHKACIGPGAQMSQKGPMWLAMGLVARALREWDGTDQPATFNVGSEDKVTVIKLRRTLLDKFKHEMAKTGSIVGIPTEDSESWASAVLSSNDIRLVEKVGVKCHIDQLYVVRNPEADNVISILETTCLPLDSGLLNNTLWCLVQSPPRVKTGPDCQLSAAVSVALSEFGEPDANDDMETVVKAVNHWCLYRSDKTQ